MTSNTRFKWLAVRGIPLALASVLIVAGARPAHAQTQTYCGPEVKDEVVKTLAGVDGAPEDVQLAAEQELYAKFQYCAADAAAWAIKLTIPMLPPVVAAVLIIGPYGLVFLAMTVALRIEGAKSTVRMLLRR